MKMTKLGQLFFTLLFLCLFATLNVWIINHSGLVRVFSLLTIDYFNFWSGTFSYGMPIILGIFFYVTIFGIFYMKNIFFIPEANQELDGVTKFNDLALKLKSTIEILNKKRLGIILSIIGFELATMNIIDYVSLSQHASNATCSAVQIVQNLCESSWVTLAGSLESRDPLVSIKKSSRLTHYQLVDKKWPLLVKWQDSTYSSVNILPEVIVGIVEKINPSHFVFFNKNEFPHNADQIRVINIDRNPNDRSIIGIVISALMALIGFYLLRKKS